MAAENEIHTLLEQREDTLAFAADATPVGAAPTERMPTPPSALRAVAGSAATAAIQSPPAGCNCQQKLTLSFFFDGTGNNLDADTGSMQHSNVARLYLSHQADDETLGRFRFYVYGLGTYFAEIGDDGNTLRGKGMGHKGQERIKWAFDKFEEKVKAAEARAENPTNKIVQIKVNVFGFSRGATAARAFVRDLEKKHCKLVDNQYRLTKGNHPVEVSFLGIFDTVASVGMPMSANNTPLLRSAGMYSTTTATKIRAGNATNGVLALAFGEPGADPAPGSLDGHASWADGLQIPAPILVKACTHMVAGHEIRNSFPVDSALDGRRYPGSVVEMVYPGAHSDVGGGYQPGEGARSEHYGEVLSLIPLRSMHAAAIAAGVPLMDLVVLSQQPELIRKSFALDAEGAQKFAVLADHFNHYRTAVSSGGRHIGAEILAHSLWYLRWRFFSINRDRGRAKQGQGTRDGEIIGRREPGFAEQRRRMQAQVDALEKESDAAERARNIANARLQEDEMGEARYGQPASPELKRNAAEAEAVYKEKRARYLAEKAKLDTYANDSTLAGELAEYDQSLMRDAEAIVEHHRKNPSLKLRPHYRNLVTAYLDEFVNNKGLSDPKIIAFFDEYVHDSLSGFATDSTLPSDPRVIYIGGDNKMQYANLSNPDSNRQVA